MRTKIETHFAHVQYNQNIDIIMT